MMYGILVALGFKASQTRLLTQLSNPIDYFWWIISVLFRNKKIFLRANARYHPISLSRRLLNAYVTTFFLTLTNPATILDFTALFTGLNIDVSGLCRIVTLCRRRIFRISSLVVPLMLCRRIILKKKCRPNVLRYINYIAGIAIFSFMVFMHLSKLWK